jgi:molecular chaperone DnaK
MQNVIGIDLGTSNSCVAVVKDGRPTVIANRSGYKTTPSIVAVTEKKRRIVGQLAKRQAISNAKHTAHTVKRLIGRAFRSLEVNTAKKTTAYEIVEGAHGDVKIVLQGDRYSVPEISAMVLTEMKVVAEGFLGEPVQKAVVTVPAYFNDNQRQATKDAGAIAGLEVIRIINEPTAAALAYGFGKNEDKTIAVYDLGGGTFDISILDVSADGVFKVLSAAGDAFLGGVDFDARTVDMVVQSFLTEHSVDLRRDTLALQRLNDAAERAKIELSGINEVELNLPFIATTPSNDPLHVLRPLTRQEFDQRTADLVKRTLDIVQEALDAAELEKDDIDDVLLVGGMTRVPRVQRAVAEFFGREPQKGVHPDEAVALGAAIQGAALVDTQGELDQVLLLDVTPHALGLMTHGGGFEELIAPNTTVPTNKKKLFTTARDGQTIVEIVVMQGASEKAAENDKLGRYELTGLRSAPAGQVSVEVLFAINADGIVAVSAKDLESGKEQSISVTATSGLTPEERTKMIADAKRYAHDVPASP